MTDRSLTGRQSPRHRHRDNLPDDGMSDTVSTGESINWFAGEDTVKFRLAEYGVAEFVEEGSTVF